MRPFHMLLAVLVAVIWGVALVVSKIGLESFTPPQLTALRFLVAGVGVLWLPRPAISCKAVVLIGLTVFTGQFLLQFFGIAFGMPAGPTAFVVQTQAPFTVVFAAMMSSDSADAAACERDLSRGSHSGTAEGGSGLQVTGVEMTRAQGQAITSSTSAL